MRSKKTRCTGQLLSRFILFYFFFLTRITKSLPSFFFVVLFPLPLTKWKQLYYYYYFFFHSQNGTAANTRVLVYIQFYWCANADVRCILPEKQTRARTRPQSCNDEYNGRDPPVIFSVVSFRYICYSVYINCFLPFINVQFWWNNFWNKNQQTGRLQPMYLVMRT